jgi:hypothetical protein
MFVVAGQLVIDLVLICQSKNSNDAARIWHPDADLPSELISSCAARTPYIQNHCDVLVGFADANYLSDLYKGRSQTGYIFTMGNTALSWKSTKQSFVATFSNYAEIIALHEAVHECI